MKIKNSVQSISPDISIILTCVGLLIACPLRIFQMLQNVDPATGFYINTNSIVIYILYGVLALAALLVLILTFLSADIPASVAPKGKRIPFAIASLAFALTLFYEPLSPVVASSDATATISQITPTSQLLTQVHNIFAYVAGVYFVILFIAYLTGNELHKKFRLLSLTPLVWVVTRVLKRITIIISVVRVSELLLELCALVFMMIFFMAFARIISDVNATGSMWSAIACGSITILFVLTYTLPRLMLTITGNTQNLVAGYPLNVADIGLVIFAIFFIVTMLRSGYSIEDVKKMNAELEAQKEQSDKIQHAVENVTTMTETGKPVTTAVDTTEDTTEETTEESTDNK